MDQHSTTPSPTRCGRNQRIVALALLVVASGCGAFTEPAEQVAANEDAAPRHELTCADLPGASRTGLRIRIVGLSPPDVVIHAPGEGSLDDAALRSTVRAVGTAIDEAFGEPTIVSLHYDTNGRYAAWTWDGGAKVHTTHVGIELAVFEHGSERVGWTLRGGGVLEVVP